jgi:hypothetical protein
MRVNYDAFNSLVDSMPEDLRKSSVAIKYWIEHLNPTSASGIFYFDVGENDKVDIEI